MNHLLLPLLLAGAALAVDPREGERCRPQPPPDDGDLRLRWEEHERRRAQQLADAERRVEEERLLAAAKIEKAEAKRARRAAARKPK